MHCGWDIWDKEDISRRVRQLSREQQVKLVNTFFPQQRFQLLGKTADGRWQTTDDFFAPYMAARGAFGHDWSLIGRSEELASLLTQLEDDSLKVILLTGAGGAGKSRVLKEAIETYQIAHPNLIIRFLSPTQDATGDSLDELSNTDKLLVVDDAHDRNDLPILFHFVAVPENRARLLLSVRPYGRDYIKFEAGNLALTGASCMAEVALQPLSLEHATELARRALERFGGPTNEAETIARLTRDCLLATVIGAQVVATNPQHFELVKNEEVFRSTLLGKFQDVVAGRIGTKNDTEKVRKVLRVLALIQPFYADDPAIAQVVAEIEGIDAHEVSRFIRALIEAGVLFRRGGRHRLSPDLLADHLIEDACIGPCGISTGYAEKVFALSGDRYIEHLLRTLVSSIGGWQMGGQETADSSMESGGNLPPLTTTPIPTSKRSPPSHITNRIERSPLQRN